MNVHFFLHESTQVGISILPTLMRVNEMTRQGYLQLNVGSEHCRKPDTQHFDFFRGEVMEKHMEKSALDPVSLEVENCIGHLSLLDQ
jgi:hypothetical protein